MNLYEKNVLAQTLLKSVAISQNIKIVATARSTGVVVHAYC